MGRFLAGLLIGILIGTGGTMAITRQDVIGAWKASSMYLEKVGEIVAKHTDPETAREIVQEIARETVKTEK